MLKALPIFAVLALTAASAANAGTLIVGRPGAPCPRAQYSIIAAAIEAAAPGDVVEICPAVYAEQLTITRPVTLRGIEVNGVNRVLIQPAVMIPAAGVDAAAGGQPFEAVITVADTHDVRLQNLAIDAGNNNVNGCSPQVAGVHYYGASGKIENSAVFGAQVSGCATTTVLQGNGTGIQIDADPAQSGDFDVSVIDNTIERFTRNGIEVVGAGVTAKIRGNAISGQGPGGGGIQFGVYILNGAVVLVQKNVIHEGPCGALSQAACGAARTEGVVLRAPGDGTTVDDNIIANAQSGIFVNGGKNLRITNNLISDIDLEDGIDIQGTAAGFLTGSQIANNTILNVGPVTNQGCGVFEASGTGVSGNLTSNNTVQDAYCGVAYVGADRLSGGTYQNTLYNVLNADQPLPAPVEP